MASKIVSASWELVWAEKRLLLIPLFGFIVAAIFGCFAIVTIGSDILNEAVPGLGNLSEWSELENLSSEEIEDLFADVTINYGFSQLVINFLQGLVTVFFQFATLTAVFQALAGKPYSLSSAIHATLNRLGRVLLFALSITILGAVVGVVVAALMDPLPGLPGVILSIAIWLAYGLVITLLLPVAVAEEGNLWESLARSWALGQSVVGTYFGGVILLVLLIIAYGFGLILGMGILLLLLLAIDTALVALWLLVLLVALAVFALSTQVMVAAFQALLYQHARQEQEGFAD